MNTGRGRGRGSRRRGTPAPVRRAMEILRDRKAVDPLLLDLRGLASATDYFLIVSGTSDAHVRGMAEHLVEALVPSGGGAPPPGGAGRGRGGMARFLGFG